MQVRNLFASNVANSNKSENSNKQQNNSFAPKMGLEKDTVSFKGPISAAVELPTAISHGWNLKKPLFGNEQITKYFEEVVTDVVPAYDRLISNFPKIKIEAVIYTPARYLDRALEALQGTPIKVGGQHWRPGAVNQTGANDISHFDGIEYMLCHHSETVQREGDLLKEQVKEAFLHDKNLTVCFTDPIQVHEAIYEAYKAKNIDIFTDREAGAPVFDKMKVVLEPTDAIGAKAWDGKKIANFLFNVRKTILKTTGSPQFAEKATVGYGGGINASTVDEFYNYGIVDNLIGGLSLTPNGEKSMKVYVDTCNNKLVTLQERLGI